MTNVVVEFERHCSCCLLAAETNKQGVQDGHIEWPPVLCHYCVCSLN